MKVDLLIIFWIVYFSKGKFYTAWAWNEIPPENYLTKLIPHIDKLKPWSHKDSIIIDDNLIITVLDYEHLEKIKEYTKNKGKH